MIYFGLVAGLALVAASAHLAVRALREEYLVPLYWHRHGGWLFERSLDGRYQRLSAWSLPAALIRFLSRTWSPRPALAWSRSPERALSGGG